MLNTSRCFIGGSGISPGSTLPWLSQQAENGQKLRDFEMTAGTPTCATFSPDGQSIALSGTRDQQGYQNWVYLVALDGSGARALAGTRGGDSPKFSPSGDRIAFHLPMNTTRASFCRT